MLSRLSLPLFACILSVFANALQESSTNNSAAAAELGIVDQWRYSLQPPSEQWNQAEFDDSDWQQAEGGFGVRSTPGARVGTVWNAKDIWLRKTIELAAVPSKPALLVHHDEDIEVYINGAAVLKRQGFLSEYQVFPIGQDRISAIRAGTNTLAVHCHQRTGGQFVDVHLIDADRVPKLPRPAADLKPFPTELITQWGAEVTPENAWTEYPRPQLVRDAWQNLNGLWDYAITPIEDRQQPVQWDGQILVPYCLESQLGGVQRKLDAGEALWYRRTIKIDSIPGQQTMLNFEAVDYRCEVFVNGIPVGVHQGGNTPFAVNITKALRAGDNELVVRVEDETEGWQLRGKQVLNARGIWYTQVSGIWQTVWLEQVPSSYIADLHIASDANAGTIHIRPELVRDDTNTKLWIVVKEGDRTVAETIGNVEDFIVTIPNAKLWSPASPTLYDLEITLVDAAGEPLDRVNSYAGIRSVGSRRDDDGHLRFTLNGEPIFHWGPLDQGWWPDGLLTPPSDAAMLSDIEFLKAAGFNMIRKHIKIEPRRYYYHCDRLGMMLWQDHVSAGHNPPWTRLKPNPQDADWPDQHHLQFMVELDRMIDTLENHPSIVVWVPFNEAWGQHRTVEVGKYVVRRDPTRLVNVASGGNFWPIGDIVDHHNYPHPDFPFDQKRYRDFIKVIGEFGGHGYPVQGHLWDANRENWGYGGLPKTKEEYKQRYETSLNMLNDFRLRGIAAGVYTQTTDVEGEINGLMTYDRKVAKIPAADLAELHRRLFQQ